MIQNEVDYRKEKMKSRAAWGVATFFAVFWMLGPYVTFALPMIILFIIFQDKLVKGMMAGAVKG